jgi:hypothetical protein
MRAPVTFGDLLEEARGQLRGAAALPVSELPAGSVIAARMMGRMALTLSRYLGDIAPYGTVEAIASGQLDAQMRAAVDARDALQMAAACLAVSDEVTDLPHGGEPHGRLPSSLAAAGSALAAGRDLLRTHCATGLDGLWSPRSGWSALIISAPVSRALAQEAGRWSWQLGRLAARLSLAAGADARIPVPVRQGLADASTWLLTASAVIAEAQRGSPATAADAKLLHAIPAAVAPRRQLPAAQAAAGLAVGVAVSAARLRAVARATTRQTSSPPEMTSESWRWTATGAAVICHVTELTLTALAEPGSGIGGARRATAAAGAAVAAQLGAAAEAAARACACWREAVTAWDEMTTETQGLTAPGVIDTGELVVQVGRLAFTDPQWTPGRARRCALRDPADLAPDAAQAAVIVGAVHDAADALACAAGADLAAVSTAIRASRIHVPTRTLPDSYDVPYRYGNATPATAAALLDVYQAACDAADALAAALDTVAVTLDSPSRALAAARLITRPEPSSPEAPRTNAGRRAALEAVTRYDPVSAAQLPHGPVEQAARRLGTTDMMLLLRARAIDKAGRELIAEAKNTAARGGAPGAARASGQTAARTSTAAAVAARNFPAQAATPAADGQPGDPARRAAAPARPVTAYAGPPAEDRQRHR